MGGITTAGVTKGEFARLKLLNMAKFVAEGVGKENLPGEFESTAQSATGLSALLFATTLQEHSKSVFERDWDGIDAIPSLPAFARQMLSSVRSREEMHDKFWRYLELFVELVS